MDAEAHRRAKALFLEVLARPIGQRATFLADATVDDENLRADVEALLAHHDEDTTARPAPATSPRFRPGDVFAGRFRMAVLVGEGGMGQVWRADDLVIGEPVALKLLRAPERQLRASLLSEARLARRITHPSVCRVFDIGDHDGEVYLSMELIDGEDLASLLRRVGRLPLERALDLGEQMCDGLAAAHACGVWHRDLKPANVLIDAAGRARLTDFGIAVTPDMGPGRRAGTPGYMAPEQTVAGGPVGPATDLWAFGIVFVEMLTGDRPRGADLSHLEEGAMPTPWEQRLPSDLPVTVRDVLRRCLVVATERRLADSTVVRDVLAEARRSPGIDVADRSVLVLPFANLSADPDNEYFSDGLTEDVIAELARIDSLRVISRGTAMRFKGCTPDLVAVGRDLRVRYVLEGSVRRVADTLRIGVQLADLRHDRTVWSDQHTGAPDQVFDVQRAVARAIAGALRVRLTTGDHARLSQPRATTGLVYDLYLRTRRDILSFDPARLERARLDLEEAHLLNDGDPLLCAGLGLAYWQLFNTGLSTDATLLDKADACAERLLRLDPSGPYGPRLRAHLAAARGRIHDWVRFGADALEVAPRDPDALYWLGLGWTWAGQPEAARPIFARLEEIDPLDDYLHFGMAFLEQTEGRFEAALRWIRRARSLQPAMVAWPMTEIHLLLQLRRTDDAARVADAALAPAGTHPLADMTRALVLACGGDGGGAARLLTPELQARLWFDLQYAYFVAMTYTAMRKDDDALRWLTQSTRRGFIHHPYLAHRDPLLAPLRAHAGFTALMQDVRASWAAVSGRSGRRGSLDVG